MMDAFNDPLIEMVVLMTSSQIGKALAIDTPLPTPSGWKVMADIQIGDLLFDQNGNQCEVTFATDIMFDRPCYSVRFSDGSEIIADAEHQWCVESELKIIPAIRSLRGTGKGCGNKGWLSKGISCGILMTEQIKETLHCWKNRNTYAVPVAKMLQISGRELPIDPYALGVWLGDGHSYSPQISCSEKDIEVVDYLRSCGLIVEIRNEKTCKNLKLKLPEKENGSLSCRLREMKLLRGSSSTDKNNRKHIPHEYLWAGTKQRLSLLQGLMDTDGSISENGRCEFSTTSKEIADGVDVLLSSLGIKHTIKTKIPTCTYKGEKVIGKKAYRFSFLVYNEIPIFRLKRKLGKLPSREGRITTETERRRIIKVEKVKSVPVRCIQVNSESHLYLAGKQMIPTHNTECLNNMLGYVIDKEPSPILIVYPTLEMGQAWSKDRLSPMLRDTGCIQRKVSDVASRESENTIMHKGFDGGHLTISGANSAASLASRPVRVVLCDEVDRYPVTAGTEGDPVRLAFKRCATFWNRKKLVTSTPTVRGISRIERFWDESDKRLFYVPCPHCDVYQVLSWKNVRWPKAEDGSYQTDKACYICEFCQKPITDGDKPGSLAKGEWRKTAQSKGVAGFHINELYSPWVSFREMAEDFLEAKKSPDTLQVFINTSLGEVWDESGETISDEGLMARREQYYAEIPEEVVVLTCGVDVQDDRIEAEVVGWGPGEESWNVVSQMFHGDPAKPEVWQDLDLFLQKDFQHEVGCKLKIACTCIDSGGHHTQAVYSFVKQRQHRRIFAVKGSNQPGRPIVGRYTTGNNMRVKLFPIGTDTAKELVYGRLKIESPGPSFCHFPIDRDMEYFKQLTAEKMVQKFSMGKLTRKWVAVRKRNEALDMRIYATAALYILNPDFDVLSQIIKEQAEEIEAHGNTPQPETELKTADDGQRESVDRVRQRRHNASFTRGWR